MEVTRERIKNILGIGKNSWYGVFLIISIFLVLFCLNSLFQQRVYDSFTLVLGGYTYFLKFLYTNYKNSNKESFIDNFIFETEEYEVEKLKKREAITKIVDVIYEDLNQDTIVIEDNFIVGKKLFLTQEGIVFFKNITDIYYENLYKNIAEENQVKKVLIIEKELNKNSFIRIKDKKKLDLMIERVREYNSNIEIKTEENILTNYQAERSSKDWLKDFFINTDITDGTIMWIGCIALLTLPLIISSYMHRTSAFFTSGAGIILTHYSILNILNEKNKNEVIMERVRTQVSLSSELSLKNFRHIRQVCNILNKDIITRDKHHLYGKNWLISSENIIYINNIKNICLKRVRRQSRYSFVYYLKIYFINKNDGLMFFDETFAYAPISKESEKIKNINDCVNYVYKIYSYLPLEIPVLYESTFKREEIKLEELDEKLDDSLIF